MKSRSIRKATLGILLAGTMMVISGMGVLDANASTITLTNAQIQLAQPPWVATNNVLGTTTQIHLVGSNQFTSFFDASYSAPPAAIAAWTLDIANIGALAGDVFSLTFLNSNANDWDFQLSVTTTAAVTLNSAFVSLAPNAASTLSIVLPASTIDTVTVRVRGAIPLGPDADDRTANFNVYSAPEPASLLLLGVGLTSLAVLKRRKG